MSLAVLHGGPILTTVKVDAYDAELRDGEGFIGDRASKRWGVTTIGTGLGNMPFTNCTDQ